MLADRTALDPLGLQPGTAVTPYDNRSHGNIASCILFPKMIHVPFLLWGTLLCFNPFCWIVRATKVWRSIVWAPHRLQDDVPLHKWLHCHFLFPLLDLVCWLSYAESKKQHKTPSWCFQDTDELEDAVEWTPTSITAPSPGHSHTAAATPVTMCKSNTLCAVCVWGCVCVLA